MFCHKTNIEKQNNSVVKRLILFFVFLGIWTQIFAQELDKFVVGKDTTNCQIKIGHKKGEIVVSFKKAYQSVWNEIYAVNANAAFVSDKTMYLSQKLPDTPDKVWTKCFFDGTYKLLQYNNKFYIVGPKEITKLNESSKEPKNEKSSAIKLFIGQMILIFHNKVDYNFNQLSYDSKSLVLPLIEYHKANRLQYHDYNRYTETDANWSFDLGLSMDKYSLSTQPVKLIETMGFSPFVSSHLNINFPQLSKRLFFSGGIEVSVSYFKALKIRSVDPNTYYFNLSYQGLNLAIPVMAQFKFIQKPGLDVSLASGLKLVKEFSLDQSLTLETEKDNVVRTEFVPMESISEVTFFHRSELLFRIPKISKLISLGTSYEYLLSKETQKYNIVSLDRSTSVFARFNF